MRRGRVVRKVAAAEEGVEEEEEALQEEGEVPALRLYIYKYFCETSRLRYHVPLKVVPVIASDSYGRGSAVRYVMKR